MDDTGRVLLELYRAARELPVPEFQGSALALLKSALRFDSGMWGAGEIVPNSGLAIQCIHLYNQPQEMLAAYEEIKDRNLAAAFEAGRHVGQVCNFNYREMNVGPAYAGAAAHCRKFDMQNGLVATFHDQAMASIRFISLWRADEGDRYLKREQLLGEYLLPHLFEAGMMNRLLWLNQMTVATIAKRGARAIADKKGDLHSYDLGFIDVLRKEWTVWSPPFLPALLLQSLHQSPERRFLGKRISVRVAIVGEMLFLRAHERSAVDALTPAQLAVGTLVANGLSYKQVAKQMGLSPATVRNQLHRIYQKLDISNKTTLARCLGEASP